MIATSPRLAGFTALVIPAVILPIVVPGRVARRNSRARATASPTPRRFMSEAPPCTPCRRIRANRRNPCATPERVARIGVTAKKRIAMTGTLTALVILLTFGAITAGAVGRRASRHQRRDGGRRAGPVFRFTPSRAGSGRRVDRGLGRGAARSRRLAASANCSTPHRQSARRPNRKLCPSR